MEGVKTRYLAADAVMAPTNGRLYELSCRYTSILETTLDFQVVTA